MSNLIRILFLALALPSLLLAQGETGLIKSFGDPDTRGSFEACFSKLTAGIVWLKAKDHYVTAEAANSEEKASGDYLLLIDNPDHALRLIQQNQQNGALFAKDPAQDSWEMQDIRDGVKFTLADGEGLVLEKVFLYDQQARGFTVTLTLRNETSEVRGNQLFWLNGPTLVSPKVASLFGDVSVAIAAPLEGDAVTLGPSPEFANQQFEIAASMLAFAGSSNRFFGAFVYPKDDASRTALSRLTVQTVPPRAGQDDNPSTRVIFDVQLTVPGKGLSTSVNYGLYLGPKSYRVFETLPEPALFEPILVNDLEPPCCGMSVPGGRFMATTLLSLLGWFYGVFGNWGVSIIFLTVLVRGAMFPLNFKMQKSMRLYGAKMSKLKPKMDEMKKKYADDQKAYQQAMMAFNRENKVMPPIGGCLPIFLTMPIYIGLFTALRTAYDLRHAPFFGWINDLSSSDQLFELGFWPDDFNLLPLIWIVLLVFQMSRQPLPTDPQQRQTQKIMRFMPMMFGVMLYSYASALLLYMVTSMLWSLVESAIVKKILGPADPNSAMMPTPM
ncbi:MAG: YidC/Oxa1 family membrane protein insertase [Hyphomicrobiaceae bacterium]|jgi:YidC/Oxa1 family membrane protein insertase